MKHAKTRIQDIYLHLKSKGFDVYFPAEKVGECTSNYIVLRDASSTKFENYSSTITYYDIMCYVPRNKFSQLAVFVEEVKEAMKELVPMIKPTYTETQSYYDDTIKGHMQSVEYKNYRKIL